LQGVLDLSLYVITDRLLSRGRSHREVVEKAINGGATCVQLREKDITSREFFASALELRKLTREKGVALIINDRLDIALAVGADGVHLGQDDLPFMEARRLMPPGMILGASTGDLQQALEAQSLGASYLGVGAIFKTGTKADAGEPIGLQALSSICSNVSIPVIGIGGINSANARLVIEAGAAGVAVISSVVAAPDIAAAAGELAWAVKQALAPDRNPQKWGKG
jgi:thiamine-phosphate pyrophosphorylase